MPEKSIQASVTPWASIPRRARNEYVEDSNWQQYARRFDSEGPGIVGAALDIPAAASTLVTLCVSKFTGKGMTVVDDDPLVEAVLRGWHGKTTSQAFLLARLIRTLDSVAEGYLVLDHEPATRSMTWDIAQTPALKDNKDGTVTIVDSPNIRRGDPGHRIVADRYIHHFRQSDPTYPGVAWSPIRRGLQDIENYRRAQRNIARGLDSQLAMNGILWAESIRDKTRWQDNLAVWAQKSITSDDGIESTIPFPMDTRSKPEFIEVGRGNLDSQMKASDHYLRSFAQSTDLPTQWLTEGPAQGKFSNSFLENDFFADYTMRPRLQRAAQIITVTHLRPFLKALEYDADQYLITFDDTALRAKTDNSEKVLEARRMGLATREAAAEAAGLSPDQLLELPEGVTDYESWLTSRVTRTGSSTGVDSLINDDQLALPQPSDTTQPPIEAAIPELPAYWNELTPA